MQSGFQPQPAKWTGGWLEVLDPIGHCARVPCRFGKERLARFELDCRKLIEGSLVAASELPRTTARFHECRLSLFDMRAPSFSKVHTFCIRHFSVFNDGTTVQDRFCNMMRQGNEKFSGSAVFCTEPEEKLWPLDS